MKIISLNTFGGTFFEPLMEYVMSHASDTDIFCFQEILHTEEEIKESAGARANLFAEMTDALNDFTRYFSPTQEHFLPTGYTENDIHFGMAIYIKKGYQETFGQFFMNGYRNSLDPNNDLTMPTLTQYVQFQVGGEQLTVCNVHGIAWPGNKLDSPIRLEQTRKILAFVESQPGEKIICGDFNLLPETKSVIQFEEHGFRNLVNEYNIKSTRGSLVKKIHPEYEHTPEGFQEFADYTFVSSGIHISHFDVPNLPISDHLPMIVEFDLK